MLIAQLNSTDQTMFVNLVTPLVTYAMDLLQLIVKLVKPHTSIMMMEHVLKNVHMEDTPTQLQELVTHVPKKDVSVVHLQPTVKNVKTHISYITKIVLKFVQMDIMELTEYVILVTLLVILVIVQKLNVVTHAQQHQEPIYMKTNVFSHA